MNADLAKLIKSVDDSLVSARIELNKHEFHNCTYAKLAKEAIALCEPIRNGLEVIKTDYDALLTAATETIDLCRRAGGGPLIYSDLKTIVEKERADNV